MDERLERLESKLAFAEDLLETLNQTVFRQQEQIGLLQQQLRLLYQQMHSQGGESEKRDPREEIPPHY